MPVDRVDTYYYTANQSTADYSQPQTAGATEPTHRPDTTPDTTQASQQGSSPEQEQPVRVYFFDASVGQYVNLLV